MKLGPGPQRFAGRGGNKAAPRSPSRQPLLRRPAPEQGAGRMPFGAMAARALEFSAPGGHDCGAPGWARAGTLREKIMPLRDFGRRCAKLRRNAAYQKGVG
jgi:hypothetical protein